MTLLYPDISAGAVRREGAAGLHVFVAGVSSYRYLPGGSRALGRPDFGIGQLSAAASSAYRVCEWILNNRERFPLPLASCRLLLSPTAEELKAHPEMSGVEACTLENFLVEAEAWREDAERGRDGMTLFYFAGHGVQQSGNDAVLLLEDFNAPGGQRLRNAIDINNILAGMSPSADRPEMARTQLYFVDACRVRPAVVRKFPGMKTTGVFDVSFDVAPEDEGKGPPVVADDRHAPVFFAAVSGEAAYSRVGQFTYFSHLLLKGLEGRGGVKVETPYGDVRWQISTNSLSAALNVMVQESRQRYGIPLKCRVGGSIAGGDAPILVLADAPDADVLLEVDPGDAFSVSRVDVFKVIDGRPTAVWQIGSPLHPYPCRRPLAPGEYTINITIHPETEPYVSVSGQMRRAAPPLSHWIVRVKS